MSLIAVCHQCDYEASAENEEKIRDQIKADGGNVKYLGHARVGRISGHGTEKIKIYDKHCPNGHRLAGVVAEKHRDQLPLEHWRKQISWLREKEQSFNTVSKTP